MKNQIRNSKRVQDNTFRALFFEDIFEKSTWSNEMLWINKINYYFLIRSLFVSVIIITQTYDLDKND